MSDKPNEETLSTEDKLRAEITADILAKQTIKEDSANDGTFGQGANDRIRGLIDQGKQKDGLLVDSDKLVTALRAQISTIEATHKTALANVDTKKLEEAGEHQKIAEIREVENKALIKENEGLRVQLLRGTMAGESGLPYMVQKLVKGDTSAAIQLSIIETQTWYDEEIKAPKRSVQDQQIVSSNGKKSSKTTVANNTTVV